MVWPRPPIPRKSSSGRLLLLGVLQARVQLVRLPTRTRTATGFGTVAHVPSRYRCERQISSASERCGWLGVLASNDVHDGP
jgi:hypothetical protein